MFLQISRHHAHLLLVGPLVDPSKIPRQAECRRLWKCSRSPKLELLRQGMYVRSMSLFDTSAAQKMLMCTHMTTARESASGGGGTDLRSVPSTPPGGENTDSETPWALQFVRYFWQARRKNPFVEQRDAAKMAPRPAPCCVGAR